MTRRTTRFARWAVAAAGAITLGVLSAGTAAANGIGNIDPDEPRTLTIHKYELDGESPLTEHDGQLLTPPPGSEPLPGVTFTITAIPSVDLLTAAGWDTVAALNAAANPAAAALALGAGAVETYVTADPALPVSLPIGLYVVQETDSPSTVTNPAAPFLVTLPLPTGDEHPTNPNEWIYDVHVYPKNAVTDIDKTVVEPAEGSAEYYHGDLVRWAITADVPRLEPGQTIDSFIVRDVVDTAQLEFVAIADTPTGIVPTSVAVAAAGGATVSLVSADYEITPADFSGDTLTLTFLAPGLAKLQALGEDFGGTVTFTVLTRVVAVPENGVIENDAVSVINGSENDAEVSTTVGQLRVFKYADTDGDVQAPLAGATFQLYRSAADAAAETNPVIIDGESAWTSNDQGLLDALVLSPGQYWLVETAAPVGYQLPANPVFGPYTVVAGVTDVDTGRNYQEIENFQNPPVDLPLTGAAGTILFSIAGAGIVAIAVGAGVRHRRRQIAAAIG